jgi:hypothetical protein
MRRTLVTVFLTLALQSASAETLLLSAKPGEFLANPIGDSAETVTISTSLSLTAFDSSAAWPPAAYIGFFQGPNRNESFQFLVIRNGGNAPFLTVGYRVIEEGKEKTVASLANIPLDASAPVDLSFNKGIVTIKYGTQDPITVKTRLTKATPYVSVSSGTAQYKMRP